MDLYEALVPGVNKDYIHYLPTVFAWWLMDTLTTEHFLHPTSASVHVCYDLSNDLS